MTYLDVNLFPISWESNYIATIPKQPYESLVERKQFLCCLRSRKYLYAILLYCEHNTTMLYHVILYKDVTFSSKHDYRHPAFMMVGGLSYLDAMVPDIRSTRYSG